VSHLCSPNDATAGDGSARAGWRLSSIGQECDIVNGGTPKSNVSSYWDGGIQWITPAEMGKRISPFVAETKRTITLSGLQNSSAKELPPNSVILSSRAPIGHLLINTVAMATNQGCKGLVPRKNLYYKYLFYYLTSIVGLLNDLGVGTTFKELSGGKLKEVRIPLPSLEEQKRIVAILDQAFDGIAKSKANSERSLEAVRQLFDINLGSIFDLRGAGWSEKTIDDACTKITDGEHIRPKITTSGVPFLSSKDVLHDDVSFVSPLFVSEADACKFRKRCNPEKGDILVVSRGASVGRTCFVKTSRVFCLLGSVILLKVRPSMSPKYLTYALKSPIIRAQLATISEASAQQAIYLRDIKLLKIWSPNLVDQESIVAKLDELDAEIRRTELIYQQRLAAHEELRQSLLHGAFTGKL